MRSIPVSAVRPRVVPAAVEAARPAKRRARAPSLRLVLTLGFGLIGLLCTLAIAALAGREATRRLEAEMAGQLAEIAVQMARGLDLGMFERWRDIQVAAQSDTLRDPEATREAKRAVLRRLQTTYPAYSIIVLAEADGRISVTSSGLLEGEAVGERDYFREARDHGTYVGDVHPAKLLQKHLDRPGREPLRLVDVASPVTAADGRFLGVLAAHLDWTWAADLARGLAASLTSHRAGAEILILARDDMVLLGPPDLQGGFLPRAVIEGGRALDGAGTSRLGPWPGASGEFLSAAASTGGHRDYPGLGWRVLVRQRAERALGPVEALRRSILLAGGAVALGAACLAWMLAGLIARPLRDLAQAAEGLGRGAALPALPRPLLREGEMIGRALAGAAAELGRREENHHLLVGELNHRVKNTLATVQSIAAQSLKNLGSGAEAGREAFEARLLALSRAHDVLTGESWAGADMGGIARQAVGPFLDGEAERVSLSGPDLRLPPELALALTMILHELCTNAVKHGALSRPGGHVALRWSLEEAAGAQRLRLAWDERGGPAVVLPARKGFGTRLLERGLAGRETTRLTYEAEGFAYEAVAPLPERGAPPGGR